MKKTLELSAKKARSLYETASPELKEVLEESFGKEFFSEDVIDRINGWEDMMSEADRPDVPEFSDVPEDMRPWFKALYRGRVMTEAYNQGQNIDIYDSEQKRYYSYFDCNGSPSAFRFNDWYCDHTGAHAGSGSRLSFSREEAAVAAGKKHPEIFREMLDA